MTAPEREALVKALREGADFYARERPRAIPCKSDAEIGPNECEAIAKRMDHAADMIEAQHRHIEMHAGDTLSLDGEIQALREELEALSNAPAVTVTEEMVERGAILFAAEDNHTELFDEPTDERGIMDEARAAYRRKSRVFLEIALKSTTPQTGSQE